MKHKILISPLRYPGSKRRLAKYMCQTLKANELIPELYVEPFAGGASIALQLLEEKLVKKVILMDLDPWVASFWRVLFFDTNWLIHKIETIPVTLEKWNKFKRGDPQDERGQALTCLFLNRTSFSGILEKAVGPLGGREQKSKYKIDCRFNRERLVIQVSDAAAHREQVCGVWNCSWDEGLKRIRNEQAHGKLPATDLFFYLDPPFFEKAEELYRFCFTDEEHKHLRDRLLKLKDKWLLSYDSVDQVEQLYGDAIHNGTNGTNRNHIERYYSLAIRTQRPTAKEVIISNLRVLPALHYSTRRKSKEGYQSRLF